LLANTVGHDLTVATGGGSGLIDTSVDIESNTIGHDLTVTAAAGRVGVLLGKLFVQGRSTVRTGSGDDLVRAKASTSHAPATFDGGGGTDTSQDLGGNDFASPPTLLDFEFVG